MLTTKLHFMLLITAELNDQTRRSFLLNFIRGVDSALDLSDFTGNAGIRVLNGPCQFESPNLTNQEDDAHLEMPCKLLVVQVCIYSLLMT